MAGGSSAERKVLPRLNRRAWTINRNNSRQSFWAGQDFWDWVKTSKKFPCTIGFSNPRRSVRAAAGSVIQHARPARLNVYEGLSIDDPEKANGETFVFRARGRDLKGAIFDLRQPAESRLHRRRLQGASLVEAQLQGASLEGAQLQGASLASRRVAQLQGASLDDAQLQGASLMEPSFRARRSMARSFRARRSMARSFRARRSMARSFRALRSTGAASGRVARFRPATGACCNSRADRRPTFVTPICGGPMCQRSLLVCQARCESLGTLDFPTHSRLGVHCGFRKLTSGRVFPRLTRFIMTRAGGWISSRQERTLLDGERTVDLVPCMLIRLLDKGIAIC